MARPVGQYKPELGNEAPAVNEAELPVQIRLSIPRELYDEYEKIAGNQGLTVTELVMHRNSIFTGNIVLPHNSFTNFLMLANESFH